MHSGITVAGKRALESTHARIHFTLLAVCLSLPAADKTYVLKAAHMFDGKSDHVVSPGLVVVANGKIVAVGRQGGDSRPAPKPSISATPRCSPASSTRTRTSPTHTSATTASRN